MTNQTTLRRHRDNTSFTWHDCDAPLRRVTVEQREQFNRDGFFVYEGAIDDETLLAMTATIDPIEAAREEMLRDIGGRYRIARAGEITFTTHLAGTSPVLRDVVAGPVLRDLCWDLIGPDVRLYWDQAVYKKPGTAVPFPWHQDNGYTYVEPQQYLTCWIALTDATIDNGCPWVVPGLHRLGTLEHRSSDLGFVCLDEPRDAVPVPAAAGDAVVFSSLTPHCTGPNTTNEVRKSYIVQYAPDGSRIRVDPDRDMGTRAVDCDDPVSQFPILVGGAPPA